jgi:rhodanese-related sulfurtransferase
MSFAMAPTRISPQEASEKLVVGWTYVDVRTTQEFQEGHPPGAVNVPLMQTSAGSLVANEDFVRVMKAAFSKDAKIIVGCNTPAPTPPPPIVGCKSGGRSARAAQLLGAEGFANVVDQRAGWDGARGQFGQMTEPGWSRVGLPVEQGQPSGRAWEDMKRKA